MDTETWARHGACRGADSTTFFEVDDFVDGKFTCAESKRENAERRLRAKLICSSCPVRAECLQDALADDDEFSVRGGLAPYERRAVRAGAVVRNYGFRIEATPAPVIKYGFETVRRFVAGETVDSLMAHYGLARQTVLQDLRRHLVRGGWWRSSADDQVA